jgi:diacylglycerol O-acyltransferase
MDTGRHGDPHLSTAQRISAVDLAQLEWESPEAPMNIAAILELERDLNPAELQAALAARIRDVPRLRQRLVPPRLHLGRPLWVDNPDFDLARHLFARPCPPPADEDALLELAAVEANRPLLRDRPLWRAIHVTGLSRGRGALVVVVHHAVADGIGGLAVLRQLVDQSSGAEEPSQPRPLPRKGAARSWTTSLRSISGRIRLVPGAFGDLVSRSRMRATHCSLNHPIGSGRCLAVARADLVPLVAAAHRQLVTVNDLLLTAAADALRAVLASDGENLASLVVSVPVSRRTATTATRLGNQVGAMPVSVPCEGTLLKRLRTTAEETKRSRPSRDRDASMVWLGPVFWVLARVGQFQRFVRSQHLINTFLTNVHGPTEELTLLGTRVTAVTPVSPIAGNVTVAFTAFSYAGVLSVTVVADRDRWPDARPIAAALDRALRELLEQDRSGSPALGDAAVGLAVSPAS